MPLTPSTTGAYFLKTAKKRFFITSPPRMTGAESTAFLQRKTAYDSLGANEKEDGKWEQFYLSLY